MIYIVGYHTAAKLFESTSKMREEEIERFLKRYAGIHSAYLVSNKVIGKIWRKENHVAKSNSDWKYFSVRPRHLKTIIENRPLERSGVRHMPSRWYGLIRPELLLQSAPDMAGKTSNLKFGTILDKKEDKEVIKYMQSMRLL